MLQVRPRVPNHDELFWPTITAFRALGGSSDRDQLIEKVGQIMSLSEEIQSLPHRNGPSTEFAYRVGWVLSWLKWGGMLDNPSRGIWVLTPAGRLAAQNEIDSILVKRRVADKNKRNLAKAPQQDSEDPDIWTIPNDGMIPEEPDWKSDLLDTIKAMDPGAFERLAKLLLLQLGLFSVTVTGGSGDGGIDAIGVVKINSVLTFKVIVQCKRFKGSVGAGELRNFRGAMQGRTDKAIFITTGTFTSSAKIEASRDGVPAIDLIDGEALAFLLKDEKLGVKTEMVEKVSVVKEFFSNI